VQFQSCDGGGEHVDFVLQRSLPLAPQPTPKSIFDECGTIQLKQLDMEAARFAERLKPTSVLKWPYVLGRIVEQGMKNAVPLPFVVGVRIEIAFEQIAFEAGVNQVIVVVTSALRNRAEMVHRQRCTRVCLRNAAVAA